MASRCSSWTSVFRRFTTHGWVMFSSSASRCCWCTPPSVHFMHHKQQPNLLFGAFVCGVWTGMCDWCSSSLPTHFRSFISCLYLSDMVPNRIQCTWLRCTMTFCVRDFTLTWLTMSSHPRPRVRRHARQVATTRNRSHSPHTSHITPHTSHIAPHTLTPHTSHLTPSHPHTLTHHTSHLTHHSSHLTHLSHLTPLTPLTPHSPPPPVPPSFPP